MHLKAVIFLDFEDRLPRIKKSSEAVGFVGPTAGGHAIREKMVRGRKTVGLSSTILFPGSSMAEHLAVNERVAGSSPARGANFHFCYTQRYLQTHFSACSSAFRLLRKRSQIRNVTIGSFGRVANAQKGRMPFEAVPASRNTI